MFTRGPHGFRGDTATNIRHGDSLLMKVVEPIMQRWLRGAGDAARAVLRAATADGLRGITGRFLDDKGELRASQKYADATLRAELMTRAAAAVGA